ncbi:hypothetical protein GCM10022403_078420 [Streptomyces coacervatus]|uniref:Uncharacterized protein n=1 Tax=Streptomyces coacervatus TaxID=647381 RepID=A0ABP7J457_9ACTN
MTYCHSRTRDLSSVVREADIVGGVGPMTIATLLEQTVDAAARQLGV